MLSSRLSPWTVEQARTWYWDSPWLCGFNYLPGAATNSHVMWQEASFDPALVERELDWAERIGLNSCRVFLHYVVWKDDAECYLERIRRFLSIADSHHISTIFCLFDDSVFSDSSLSLSSHDVEPAMFHPDLQADLRAYVDAIVTRFAQDPRVLFWDLYHQSPLSESGLAFLQELFQWARLCQPDQPLTTSIWSMEDTTLNEAIVSLSDIVTFQQYGDVMALEEQISALKKYRRPLICTAWFDRAQKSLLQSHLPVFRRELVGCYLNRLVMDEDGVSETILVPDGLLYPDGRFFDENEHDVLNSHLYS